MYICVVRSLLPEEEQGREVSNNSARKYLTNEWELMAKSEMRELVSTGGKTSSKVWGKLREREVTSTTLKIITCIVLGYFFLMQSDIG